ncbi:MAG: hypothetical protein ACOCQW_05240, partial [Halanaerobiaceae bacterium]
SLYTQRRTSTRPSRPSKYEVSLKWFIFYQIYLVVIMGSQFDFLLFIAWKRSWATLMSKLVVLWSKLAFFHA